jgi:hypothetical protein
MRCPRISSCPSPLQLGFSIPGCHALLRSLFGISLFFLTSCLF